MIAFVTLFSPDSRADFVAPFAEDWESGSIDTARWNSWGYPLPVLQSGGNAIGDYSLDPNGDASYLSGVVSADTFALSGGVRVSISAYIESASHWSELTFGLANTTAIAMNPNLNDSALAEVTIDADTQGSGYRFFTRFNGDGGVEVHYPLAGSDLTPTSVFDGWHTYMFDFAADGSAQVRVDDVLAFETPAGFFDYDSDDAFAVLLGGRIAEEITNSAVTTGAGNDLDRVTDLARKMVCEWGMSESIGPLTFGRKEEQIFLGRDFAQQQEYSEETASAIDQEMKRIVTENYNRARAILVEKKTALLQIAEELLTREVLTGAQITRIISGLPLEEPVEVAPVVASDQPTSSETERPPVVPSLGKPLPQE